jgi:hypothetical protein
MHVYELNYDLDGKRNISLVDTAGYSDTKSVELNVA